MTGEWEIPFTGWEESSERLGVSIIGSLVKKVYTTYYIQFEKRKLAFL